MTVSLESANAAIGMLAAALGYAVGDPAVETYSPADAQRARYSDGWRGSAEVCLEDAQTTRDRGMFEHAQARAERGLLYLRD